MPHSWNNRYTIQEFPRTFEVCHCVTQKGLGDHVDSWPGKSDKSALACYCSCFFTTSKSQNDLAFPFCSKLINMRLTPTEMQDWKYKWCIFNSWIHLDLMRWNSGIKAGTFKWILSFSSISQNDGPKTLSLYISVCSSRIQCTWGGGFQALNPIESLSYSTRTSLREDVYESA